MSSDSSEDEDLDKLREAADSQFINDSMFNKKEHVKKKLKNELPPSLRPTKNDDQFNSFTISPEFRNYVAKHLDQVLETKLKYITTNYDNYIKPKRRKGGIKLFYNSSHFVNIERPLKAPPLKINKTDDDVDYEKFKSVAVSPEDILSQKETKHWSNRSKTPIYTYVKTKHGLILE